MTRPEHIIVEHHKRQPHGRSKEAAPGELVVAVVSFARPDMIDPEFVEEAGEEILALANTEPAPPRLVVDFTGVRFISSAILATLVAVQEAVLERDGALRIAGVAEEILDVFRITKMVSVVDIDTDVRTAIRHLTESA